MRFFADESCDHAVILAYRRAGHDVTALPRSELGLPDHEVLAESVDQNRILLTEDKDFGELIYLAGLESVGVILFRFPEGSRHLLVAMALELLNTHADDLENGFAVVEPGRIRFGSPP